MSFCSFFGGEVFKDHFKPGIYVCSKCDHELFSSRSKYEHSSPWPAFTETIHENSVSKYKERPGAYKVPTEQAFGLLTGYCKTNNFSKKKNLLFQVKCGKCGNGLGHEFVNDGPFNGVSRF
ncbi:Methionine-R-sulfoxide reductase B1-A [Ilyodon furcidens]|uniref:Methionine-R-sulfoxide reductase B1-A n=1 Tax=Ilyodon furcidens TaxID=33524 RepID=A0ABV0T5V4_9TELE